MKPAIGIDLFCGAGGTSSGYVEGCTEAGRPWKLTAINHWPVAIATHKYNLPGVEHLCAKVETVDPSSIFQGKTINLLMASPECKHFSTARGGKPISDQRRADPWQVLRWAAERRIENIVIENVPELMSWGPLDVDRPIKARKGEFFRAYLQALRNLGYTVDHRVLCAADYGDPTTRRRLFIIARLGRTVVWPTPSHSKTSADGLSAWRNARDHVIDWSLRGASIFGRPRPLSDKTMARIVAGLQRFGGPEMGPFLISGAFMLSQQSGGAPRAVSDPVPTVATDGAIGLVEFLVPHYGERAGQLPRVHSVDEPLPTVVASCQHALVSAFLTKYYGTGVGAVPVTQPLDTVTTRDRFGLVEPVIQKSKGGMTLDIRYRMLQPHELARAQGLGDFTFTGTKTEKTCQIGNAVPRQLAKAVTMAALL